MMCQGKIRCSIDLPIAQWFSGILSLHHRTHQSLPAPLSFVVEVNDGPFVHLHIFPPTLDLFAMGYVFTPPTAQWPSSLVVALSLGRPSFRSAVPLGPSWMSSDSLLTLYVLCCTPKFSVCVIFLFLRRVLVFEYFLRLIMPVSVRLLYLVVHLAPVAIFRTYATSRR